jgi:hypothetical protein
MVESAVSVNGVPIRLPQERWEHIIDEHVELQALHDEILMAVAQPDRVLEGNAAELFAVRMVESGKALVVVYREVSAEDGFVITAFLTRRLRSLERRVQVWPRQQ